jgi:hypothetical protein
VRYFYDCEFIEDGRTIDLVSIAVVAEDGREFYAVSTEFNPDRAGKWVRANVLPKLPSPGSKVWRSRARIRDELLDFLSPPDDAAIELWAWVGAYDHVALCQLWGPMTALPSEIPRFTREIKQLWEAAGRPMLPAATGDVHDALEDARHNRARFLAIQQALAVRAAGPGGWESSPSTG